MSRPLFKTMGCVNRSIDVLAVDFGRKIRLGRMEIELFPAGCGPGSAQLKISFYNRQILYCGGVRLTKPLFSPPLEVPRCDVLLLDVSSADAAPMSSSRAARDLSSWLEKTRATGARVIACGSKTAAADVMWVLQSSGLKVHATRGLFEMYRRSSDIFQIQGNMMRLAQTPPVEGVLLVSADTWPKSRFYPLFPEDRVAFAGPKAECPKWAEASFGLGDKEDSRKIADYVQQTGADQLVLGRRCDDRLARRLSKIQADVFRVTRPIQMPFPFFSRTP